MSWSASEAVALTVSVSPTFGLLGVMVAELITGASFTGLIVMLTVAVFESTVVSFTLNVKLSAPL